MAAVSVGIVDGEPLLDLCYEEDRRAEVDMNVVMTGAGRFVEVQGTAEAKPFTPAQLERMLAARRRRASRALTALQRETLRAAGVATLPAPMIPARLVLATAQRGEGARARARWSREWGPIELRSTLRDVARRRAAARRRRHLRRERAR